MDSGDLEPLAGLPQGKSRLQGYLHRIDSLREAQASLRFLSIEPLLGDLGELDLGGIGWVIAGGESGQGARSTRADWVRGIRDQCVAAAVPFFMKQWGEFLPDSQNPEMIGPFDPGGAIRVGKRRAGRLLDGREWSEMPPRRTDA